MVSESINSRNTGSRLAQSEIRRESALRPPVGGSAMLPLNVAEQKGSSHDKNTSNFSQTSAIGLIQNRPRWMFNWFSRISGLRGTSRTAGAFSSDVQYQAVQRALLLNAYPVAYIILWLPAIANRLIEATGHSSTVMQFMQVTAQLIGLANALTYGWNEKVAKQLKERFSRQ